MTFPLTKEQIEAIKARAAVVSDKPWTVATPEDAAFIEAIAFPTIPALCQMALRAIELEAECTALRARDAGWSLQCEELEAELTATRNALEEERERCAKAVLDPKNQTGEHTPFIFGVMHDCAKAIRALPSPQVKP